MRKISANLILPVSSPPLRNGIVTLDASGCILELRDTGGQLYEEAGLEHYHGIIIPGFVIPWIRLEPDHLPDLIQVLPRYGVSGAGLIIRIHEAGDNLFRQLSDARTRFHPILEICPVEKGPESPDETRPVGSLPHEEAHDLFSKGIELVSRAFNLFHLHGSLTACSRVKNTDLEKYLREYTSTHENAVPSETDETWDGRPDILGRHPRKGILEILSSHTLEAARKIFLDDELGSLEPGKRPGLNLVSGLEPKDLKITSDTRLRVLA